MGSGRLPRGQGESNLANQKKEEAWKVRPAKEKEISTLSEMFNTVFHKDKDRRTMEWKYLENPHGKAIMWVAEDKEGEIVGAEAFMPRKIRINGKEFLTHHGADAMVLPGWQRKGILIALNTNVFEQCWKMGDALVHIFPNHRSVGSLRKVKMHPVSPVQELELSLRGRHLFKRILVKAPFLSAFLQPIGDFVIRAGRLKRFLNHQYSTRIEPVQRFDEALADVGMAALEEIPVHMVRDLDFLNWRYVDNPTKRHRCFAAYRDSKPVGYLAMDCSGKQAYIFDLLALDRPAREDLLAKAVGFAFKHGAEVLQNMALEGNGIHRMFSQAGFKGLRNSRLVPLMINVGPPGEASKPVLKDPTKWYISHCDRDVEHMTP